MRDIKLGDIVDLKINILPNPTYIVAEVKGLRADYIQADKTAILLAGIEQWLVMDDKIEVTVVE